MKHQFGVPSMDMAGCHSMQPPAVHRAVVDCCPVASDVGCEVAPLETTQSTALAPLFSESESHPGVLLVPPQTPARANLFFDLRSSVGDPPPIIPLRV